MTRHILWFTFIVAAVVTFVWPWIPVPTAANRLAAMPTSSPDFHARRLEVSAADRAFLGKAQAVQSLIVMRGGGRLVLTVIDGSQNRHAVHDPNYCLAGAGWRIHAQQDVKVPSGHATWVSLARDAQTSEAL
jgi:hypothetical protein